MVKAHDPFLGKLTSEGTGDGSKHHSALSIHNRSMLQVLLERSDLQPQPYGWQSQCAHERPWALFHKRCGLNPAWIPG